MMERFKDMVRWSFGLVLGCWVSWVSASGLSDLQAFLSQTSSGDLTFEQTVSRVQVTDKQTQRTPQKMTGRMRFIRPGRFRFDYLTPYAQTIVGDGRELWLYDPDLAQVTVRNQAQVLSDSPAGLIAAASNLDQLRAYFVLNEAPAANGLAWVSAEPKNTEAMLTQVRLGMQGKALSVLEMTDALGQRTRLTFAIDGLDQTVADEVFRFIPPKGVDVIRQ
jgi:outer membrane lipoprotein carrier protein